MMWTESRQQSPRVGSERRCPSARTFAAFAAFVAATLLAAVANAQPATAPSPPPQIDEDAAQTEPPIGPRQPAPPRSPGDGVEWDATWPRFRTWQYFATGAQAALALGSQAIPPGEGGRMRIDNGFDESVRDAIRARSYAGYVRARDISDVGLTLLINQRIIDSAVVTWWGYDKGSVAWQMAMIDLQVVTFTAAVNGIVAGVAARERPFRRSLCTAPEEEQTSDCTGNNRYRSFFSGHASTAWALAGLTCMHHANIPMYGHPVADGAACISAVGVAGTVATMRVVSDQHWASDIIVGSAFGLASGLTIPWVLHYSGGATPSARSERAAEPPAVTWSVAPTPGGALVTGVF